VTEQGVPQYRVMRCPKCGNVAFSFTPAGWRRCVGPAGCRHEWDPGWAGREVVRHRQPVTR
jgi:hypothetical protein